jgi:hypothetical protein
VADGQVWVEGRPLGDEGDAALMRRGAGHVTAGNGDGAGVGRFQAGDEAEEGRFAGAGGADEGEVLAAGDVEGEAADAGLGGGVKFTEVTEGDGGHAAIVAAHRRPRPAGPPPPGFVFVSFRLRGPVRRGRETNRDETTKRNESGPLRRS